MGKRSFFAIFASKGYLCDAARHEESNGSLSFTVTTYSLEFLKVEFEIFASYLVVFSSYVYQIMIYQSQIWCVYLSIYLYINL